MSQPFFAAGSPYLKHGLLTDERTSAELDRVENILGTLAEPIIDVGCGFGRHVIELATRDKAVSGIDPSEAMVAATLKRAGDSGVDVDVRQLGAAELDQPGHFALALCLFTTLGQRDPYTEFAEPTDEPERAALRAIANSLRDDGHLVLEVPDRDRYLAAMVEQEQLGSTKVSRRFDEASAVVHEVFELVDGATYELAYRIFDRSEIVELVEACGFEIVETFDVALVEPPETFSTIVAKRSLMPRSQRQKST